MIYDLLAGFTVGTDGIHTLLNVSLLLMVKKNVKKVMSKLKKIIHNSPNSEFKNLLKSQHLYQSPSVFHEIDSK